MYGERKKNQPSLYQLAIDGLPRYALCVGRLPRCSEASPICGHRRQHSRRRASSWSPAAWRSPRCAAPPLGPGHGHRGRRTVLGERSSGRAFRFAPKLPRSSCFGGLQRLGWARWGLVQVASSIPALGVAMMGGHGSRIPVIELDWEAWLSNSSQR
jgi:hypothetical protein